MNLSQTFIENTIILLLTAGLTGFFIPLILKRRDERKLKEQKKYEADLARQGKIIEAQAQFLDDISEQLWRFRYLATAVSFYRPEDKLKQHREAVEQYDNESWEIFQNVRANISKSRRLISEEAYRKLVQFYDDWMKGFDKKEIMPAIRGEKNLHNLNNLILGGLTSNIDDIIEELSRELELTSNRTNNSQTINSKKILSL